MASTADFKAYVAQVEAGQGYVKPLAFGLGVRRRKNDKVLDVWFPALNFEGAYGTAAVLADVLGQTGSENGYKVVGKDQMATIYAKFEAFHHEWEEHPNLKVFREFLNFGTPADSYQETDLIAYFLYDKDQAVASAEEGYFKLQLISKTLVKPHGLTLDGVFGQLTNVAWTNKGPILPEDVDGERIKALAKGEEIVVSHVDKFPYLLNFHIPQGVRVASGSQVRLGAHLASGTTVMPAGYVNFNAGTLGNAMVEGRISAGVVVDENSDLGGGVSIMGTLSGGNKNVISIGKECLLGANSGTGISLGDKSTIAAGVYVTAGAKISLYGREGQPVDINGNTVAEGENIVKGLELNGKEGLLFLQDSQSGKLIAKPNPKAIELNESLHG